MRHTQNSAEEVSRCPTCNTGWLRDKIIAERFEFEVDGKTKTVVAENVPVSECDNAECGERLSGPEAARIRHEEICWTFGLLTPREIQVNRERLGLSQERLARLTGIGIATISRWERGRLLQNRAMNTLLRLFFDLPAVRQELQEANQDPALGTEDNPKAKNRCSPRIAASAWQRLTVTENVVSQRGKFTLWQQFDFVGNN